MLIGNQSEHIDFVLLLHCIVVEDDRRGGPRWALAADGHCLGLGRFKGDVSFRPHFENASTAACRLAHLASVESLVFNTM